MSQITSFELLLPIQSTIPKTIEFESLGQKISISKTLSIESDLKIINNCRTATFLSEVVSCAIQKINSVQDLNSDPFQTGIYSAVETDPIDFFTTNLLFRHQNHPENISKSRDFYFENMMKLSPTISSCVIGINLKKMGPIVTFQSTLYGVLHALRQAELDLFSKRLKRAIVLSCFSFDDPALAYKERLRIGNDSILSEGAACLILESNSIYRDWNIPIPDTQEQIQYGIATPLITLLKKGQNEFR